MLRSAVGIAGRLRKKMAVIEKRFGFIEARNHHAVLMVGNLPGASERRHLLRKLLTKFPRKSAKAQAKIKG